METFELWTAVLSGGNTLELRVFAAEDISVSEEQRLTTRLCRLMDIFHDDWRRLALFIDMAPANGRPRPRS